MELGDAGGEDGDGTDPEQAGDGFGAVACCRDRRGTGPAMDGEVGLCSICPSPGDLLAVS